MYFGIAVINKKNLSIRKEHDKNTHVSEPTSAIVAFFTPSDNILIPTQNSPHPEQDFDSNDQLPCHRNATGAGSRSRGQSIACTGGARMNSSCCRMCW